MPVQQTIPDIKSEKDVFARLSARRGDILSSTASSVLDEYEESKKRSGHIQRLLDDARQSLTHPETIADLGGEQNAKAALGRIEEIASDKTVSPEEMEKRIVNQMAFYKSVAGRQQSREFFEPAAQAQIPGAQQKPVAPPPEQSPDTARLKGVLDTLPSRIEEPAAAQQSDVFSRMASGQGSWAASIDPNSELGQMLGQLEDDERAVILQKAKQGPLKYTKADAYKDYASFMDAKMKARQKQEEVRFEEDIKFERGEKESTLEHFRTQERDEAQAGYRMDELEYKRGTSESVARIGAGARGSASRAASLGSLKELEAKASDLRIKAGEPGALERNQNLADELAKYENAAEYKRLNPNVSNDDALRIGSAKAITNKAKALFYGHHDTTAAAQDPEYWQKIHKIVYTMALSGANADQIASKLRSKARQTRGLPE